MSFIHADFLLQSRAAQHLYHNFAEGQPILDFHTHLSAEDIAEDRRFANLVEIWLEGDHYKWRTMRTNGVAERFCSGNLPAYEKCMAWASTVPHLLQPALSLDWCPMGRPGWSARMVKCIQSTSQPEPCLVVADIPLSSPHRVPQQLGQRRG